MTSRVLLFAAITSAAFGGSPCVNRATGYQRLDDLFATARGDLSACDGRGNVITGLPDEPKTKKAEGNFVGTSTSGEPMFTPAVSNNVTFYWNGNPVREIWDKAVGDYCITIGAGQDAVTMPRRSFKDSFEPSLDGKSAVAVEEDGTIFLFTRVLSKRLEPVFPDGSRPRPLDFSGLRGSVFKWLSRNKLVILCKPQGTSPVVASGTSLPKNSADGTVSASLVLVDLKTAGATELKRITLSDCMQKFRSIRGPCDLWIHRFRIALWRNSVAVLDVGTDSSRLVICPLSRSYYQMNQ